MLKFIIAAILLAAATISHADVIPSIVVGSHTLLPNTPHQPVQIVITGGTAIVGADIYAMVGDGGPNNPSFGNGPGPDGEGVISGPTITVDMITDTIFQHTTYLSFPQPWVGQTIGDGIAVGTSVSAQGLLGTIFVDTTGWFRGTWELDLGGGQGLYDNDSSPPPGYIGTMLVAPTNVIHAAHDQFGNPVEGVNIVDGSITIVPEPSATMLLSIGVLGFIALIWRTRFRRT
jgi:hypothetical protein